jgi:predicted DNA-binding transcriptional regulator AlpA
MLQAGLGPSTIERLMAEQELPSPVRPTEGIFVWRRAALDRLRQGRPRVAQ